PLAAIAVAAGAEYHREPAGHIRPQGVERLGERVGLVRVVDEDRRAAGLGDELEPALGAFEIFQRRKHRSRIAAGGNREASGNKRILDLKLADQRQAHVKAFSVAFEPQSLREAVDLGFDEANPGSAAADA